MTANLYCERSDVSRRLPLGALTSSSGLVAETSTGSNTFTLDGHGLESGDPITLRAAEGGTLSSPLVAGTRYYAIRVSNALFSVSSTAGGTAIDITTSAVSVFVAREPDFDEAIEFYSRWADGFFPAHIVPFDVPVPALVRGLVADLAAKRVLNEGGQDSATINALELAAKAQLERYAAGLPVRATTATPSNLALSNLTSVGDPRGWGSGGLP